MSRLPIAAKALLLCCAFIAMPAAGDVPPPSPSDQVDPFIGTGGEGHTFPGATAPFGMIQLSPDTDINKKWATAEAARPFSMTGYSAGR